MTSLPPLPAAPRAGIAFALFKYTLYALLFVDCAYFMREDFAAAPHLFANGIAWDMLAAALAQTVDTWAWLSLLVLFELETSVFAPARASRLRTFILHGLRAACYAVVVYACSGYIDKLMLFLAAAPLPAGLDPCALADTGAAWVVELDHYVPIEGANCAAFDARAGLERLHALNLVASEDALTAARRLALTDVVNSVAWIGVALVLELEVWMQLAHRPWQLRGALAALKGTLYLALGAAALYWGVAGSFLDFWDAMLWIAAFIFIEINVFNWGARTAPSPVPDSGASGGVQPLA